MRKQVRHRDAKGGRDALKVGRTERRATRESKMKGLVARGVSLSSRGTDANLLRITRGLRLPALWHPSFSRRGPLSFSLPATNHLSSFLREKAKSFRRWRRRFLRFLFYPSDVVERIATRCLLRRETMLLKSRMCWWYDFKCIIYVYGIFLNKYNILTSVFFTDTIDTKQTKSIIENRN